MPVFTRKRIVLLFFLYAIAFGPAALHGGIFWDDWTLYRGQPNLTFGHFLEAGRPQFGTLHWIGFQLPNPILLYKLATFTLNFSAALLFAEALKRVRVFSDDQRWLAAALCALLPLNQARESLVIMQYGLCLNLFLLGHLISERGQARGVVWKVLGFVLFFFSFSIEAYLPLALLTYPLYVLGTRLQYRAPTRAEIGAFIRSDWTSLIAPFVYFGLKQAFFPPYGLNAGNNVIRTGAFHKLAPATITALRETFWTAFAQAFVDGPALQLGLVFLAISMALAFFLRGLRPAGPRRIALPAVAIGLALLLATILPFVVVGKLPYVTDWESRGQSPQTISVSLLLMAAVACLPARLGTLVSIALLALSLSANVGYRVEYLWDHYKQQSIRAAFAASPQIREAKAFLVQDKATHLNALHRVYRFYEYTGLLKAAFGDQSRFAANLEEFGSKARYQAIVGSEYKAMYNLRDFTWSEPTAVAVLTTPMARPDLLQTLRMIAAGIGDPERFNQSIRGMIQLEVNPYSRKRKTRGRGKPARTREHESVPAG
jgi:hypothetical protein